MRRCRWLLGLLLLPGVGWAEAPPSAEQIQAAAQRLRTALDRYEALTRELRLDHLPGNLPDYPAVTELLDQTGARFEPLSRLLMREDQLTAIAWGQLQADLGALDRALDELTRRSFALRVWAFTQRQGFKRPEWGLAVSDSLQKLPREKAACSAALTDTVALAAARGEAESAQVVVVPLSKDLASVRVTCKGLRGPKATLPATAIACRPVGYLPMDPPVYETAWRGWWPDVLLAEGPVDVVRDQVQPLWLTVTVPRDQSPGDYVGELYVKPANSGTLRLTVKLTVWAFSLPEVPTLRAEAPLDATVLTRWYDGPGATADRKLWERFAALLQAHRVAPEISDRGADTVDLAGGEAIGQSAWWALTPQLAPPLPNLWLDRPALEQRVLPWLAWQGGCRGLRLGPANQWDNNFPRAATTAGITPNTWLTTRPAGGVGNGYGQLVYPGPHGEPLAALRLAVLRDGLEDYELFVLAPRLGEGDEALSRLLAEREKLLRAVADGVGSPEALLSWRLRVGERLGAKAGAAANSSP